MNTSRTRGGANNASFGKESAPKTHARAKNTGPKVQTAAAAEGTPEKEKEKRSSVEVIMNMAGEVTGSMTRVEATEAKQQLPSSALQNYKTRKR